MSSAARPTFVYVVMFIFIIQGIIALAILGIVTSIMSTAPPYVLLQLSVFLAEAYALIIAIAIVNFVLAYLAYAGKKWVNWIIVGLTILTLANSIDNVFLYGAASAFIPLAGVLATLAAIMIGMSCIILYAMFRKDMREYFKKPKIVT